MMTLSDDAAVKICQFLAGSAESKDGLRIKVVGGGCSGLQYKIDLDVERKGDKVFEHAGAKVLVDRKSYLYVTGSEVDYADTLTNAGFRVVNPTVKHSCGCGESFIV